MLADIWDLLIFKMAAVRHFGYFICILGPLANTTWWSLALCRIWF